LPDWLDFNSETGEFSGTPSNNHVGSLDLTVTATDSDGESVEDTFQLTISNTNDTPILQQAIADTTATEDRNFSLDISKNFSDIDANDRLTYTANLSDGSNLPNWLNFNSQTGKFSGTPSNSDIQNIDIQVTATDSDGESVEDSFQLNVSNTNNAPNIISANTVSVAENTRKVMTVAAADADGDTLTFFLSGGSDLEQFDIDRNSGEITFKTFPDFETPTDSNSDNIYQVEVTTEDGNTGSDVETIQVRVDDVLNENISHKNTDSGNENTNNNTSDPSGHSGNVNDSNQDNVTGNTNDGVADISDQNTDNGNTSDGITDSSSEHTGDHLAGGDITNQPPSIDHISLEKTVSTNNRIPLEKDIFADVFVDVEGEPLYSIRIDRLPDNGTLLLNDRLVNLGQTIPASELHFLTLEPNKDNKNTIEFYWNASDGQRFSLFSKTIEIEVQAVEETVGGSAILTAGERENQGVTPQDDKFAASDENNAIAALSGSDKIYGNGGSDLINGNQGNDTLEGGDGNDTIFGGQQADIINGGNGNDFLSGDLQEDTLTGSDGEDRFLLRNISGADIIADFEDGIDALVLPTSNFPLQPNSLTLEDLTIFQAEGGTVISVNGNAIAGLTGINATNLTEEDFQQVSSI
jgi:hypothetical protein